MIRKVWTFALVGAVAVCAGACDKKSEASAGKGAGAAKGRGPMKFPVQVSTIAARDVEYALDAVGTVEAFEHVQVTARVQGVVDKVDFAEGLEVKKDQVLAQIEPQRYQLAVKAAEAALQKSIAERDEAQSGLDRREAVVKEHPGLITGEELESYRTRARSAAAQVEANRVALDQAKLNLHDAYVRAPLPGEIETRTVQTGQYVQPGAVLATLVRRDPLLVRFKIPELDAQHLKPGMTARFNTRDEQQPFTAKITAVGQAADPKTRMVDVTAEVTDERRKSLRPGAFAEVRVPVTSVRAPVVPQSAVRPSEKGFLAFVVDDSNIAHERVVLLGLRTADGMVEVKDGLAPGERLVIRGGEALREGAEVKVAETLPSETGTTGTEVGERRVQPSDGGVERGTP